MGAKASGKTQRDWLAFDRADYLATRIILGIAVAGSVLFELGGPVVDAVNNAPLAVSYTTTINGGVQLPRGATHDGEATLELLLTDATLGERFGQALPQLFLAAMTIAVAWLLFQLLRSTQVGDPFIRRNVRRINTIALIVGLGGTLVQVFQSFADNATQLSGRLPDPSSLTFEMSLSPLPLVVMLVIALVGEAFRRGVELRDDVQGLV